MFRQTPHPFFFLKTTDIAPFFKYMFSKPHSPLSPMISHLSTTLNSPLADQSTPVHSSTSLKDSKYRKLRTLSSKGEWVFPEQKSFHEDLNTIVQDSGASFVSLGGCEVVREHIPSAARDRSMLYSRVRPSEGEAQAQICIVHGLEDHSGRYLTVILLFFRVCFILRFIACGIFRRKWVSSPFDRPKWFWRLS